MPLGGIVCIVVAVVLSVVAIVADLRTVRKESVKMDENYKHVLRQKYGYSWREHYERGEF